MFEHNKQFSAKFIYLLDRSLQQSFELFMDFQEDDNEPDQEFPAE